MLESDFIDFYDWDELDRIREKRDKREVQLMLKAYKGDKKASSALTRHREKSAVLKEKAEKTGYYWI